MIDACRRPLQEWELPHLVALGDALREQRAAAGLTQAALARKAQLSTNHLQRIEHGRRRTRLSTLHRLAAALSADKSPDALQRLVEAVGPALAPESEYRDRVDRRREARIQRLSQTRPLPAAGALVAA